MYIDIIIPQKIELYGSRGNIGHTATLYRAMASIDHQLVRDHSDRVALLSEEVAFRINKDPKAAFLGGLFHDIGKIILPGVLFNFDKIITNDDYDLIKTHAVKGYEILKALHPFSALCAGLHHAVYENGYGITEKDVPHQLGVDTVLQAVEIATIISICDFIDAATHRHDKLVGGGTKEPINLPEALNKKYSNHLDWVKVALRVKNDLAI